MNSDKSATKSGLVGRYLTVLDLKTSCQGLSASVRWTKTICRGSRMESQNCLMILIFIILGGYVIILGAYVFMFGAYSIIFGAYSIILGFAKSRPAAQRPAAHGPPRPSGPAARGPRPATARRPGGPPHAMALEARWPSPDFQQFFCPAVNPNACTDLHRVSACKMDDGEFSSVSF